MNTKIFCDIAELDQIKKFNKKKIESFFNFKSNKEIL